MSGMNPRENRMARLLSNEYSTAATTVASPTFGQGSIAGEAVGAIGSPAHVIELVQLSGGSSIASTAGVVLRYGQSSDGFSSVVLYAGDSSDVNVAFEDLGIKSNEWEVSLPTTSARGWSVLVFGK